MPLKEDDRTTLVGRIVERRKFYHDTSFWAFWLWRSCQILTVLGSAGGSLSAAMVTSTSESNTAKYAAITLSAAASVAATLLTTMKFGEHHRIRDIGLVGVSQVESELRLYLSLTEVGAEDESKLTQFLDRISAIEYDQVQLMKALEGAGTHKH